MQLFSASLKLAISTVCFLFGLYLLYEGSFNRSSNDVALLIGGAVAAALSFKIALSALQTIVWQRFLTRHSFRSDRRRSY